MPIPSSIPAKQGAPLVLETPRLLLRKPETADATAVFEGYARDLEVTRYLTWRPHARLDETQAWLLKALTAWEAMTTLTWMVTTRNEKGVIGAVELRLEAQANLGFVLSRRHWNRGFMTEAVQAVITWALGREEVERVWALCAVENLASARVLEKAGMEREALLPAWLVFPNLSDEPRDCYRYSRQV